MSDAPSANAAKRGKTPAANATPPAICTAPLKRTSSDVDASTPAASAIGGATLDALGTFESGRCTASIPPYTNMPANIGRARECNTFMPSVLPRPRPLQAPAHPQDPGGEHDRLADRVHGITPNPVHDDGA